MGNKIGIEITSVTFKLVYAETSPQLIQFITSLNSKHLIHRLQLDQLTIFMFKCSIQQLINYPQTKNIHLLHQQYHDLLSSERLVIKANRQTIRQIQEREHLRAALEQILMRKFEFEHRQRIETTTSVLELLRKSKVACFYEFQPFSIFQLGLGVNTKIEKQCTPLLSSQYLLVSLRKGISFFVANAETKLERLHGSIIGQETLKAILKFRFPHRSIKQLLDMAYSSGRILETDLFVHDIYGTNTGNLGLPGELMASNLGKIGKMSKSKLDSIGQADIARSLITFVAVNTGMHIATELQKQKLECALVLSDELDSDHFYWDIKSIINRYFPESRSYFCQYSSFLSCVGAAFDSQMMQYSN